MSKVITRRINLNGDVKSIIKNMFRNDNEEIENSSVHYLQDNKDLGVVFHKSMNFYSSTNNFNILILDNFLFINGIFQDKNLENTN